MNELILCIFAIFLVAQRIYVGRRINKERKLLRERKKEQARMRNDKFGNGGTDGFR